MARRFRFGGFVCEPHSDAIDTEDHSTDDALCRSPGPFHHLIEGLPEAGIFGPTKPTSRARRVFLRSARAFDPPTRS